MKLRETPTAEAELVPRVDLHCHILPNWDDGPSTLVDSLHLARRASEVGIRQILATPHVGRAFGNRPEPKTIDIAAAVTALQERCREAAIAIELVPGAELTLSSVDFARRVIDEPWLTFGAGSRYLLVESPFPYWPEWADQVLFELSLRDITPIIAHPERLTDVQKDPQMLQPLVERGILLQVTARSLISSQRTHRDCSHRLLKAGLVSIIASDAHSSHHPMSYEIRAELEAIVGRAAARQILVENPQAILAGTALAAPLPVAPKHKTGLLSFLYRH